jgi:predicted secreted protein with PEFG-CTERM motif
MTDMKKILILSVFVVLTILIITLFSSLPVSALVANTWTEYGENPVFNPTAKAYYPTVVKISDTSYKMWYGSDSGIGYASSTDGIGWTQIQNPVNGFAPASHPHVEYYPSGFSCGTSTCLFKIWYWNTSQIYSINAIRYAESVDGINWINDQPITGNIITGISGNWNYGSYGPMSVLYNSTATNAGTNPFDYSFAMYFDGTNGGTETIGLSYSPDGKSWILYGQVLPTGAVGTWDSSYATFGTVVKEAPGNWHMWYSGGVAASNEGIGYAGSTDGLAWTKADNNPIMSKSDGVSWRNERTYTPSVILDGSTWKMWFSGQNGSSGKIAIGYATISTGGAMLTSIAIETPATKLSYTVGDRLDISGLIVTGTYSNSTTRPITITSNNVTGFDSSIITHNQLLTITVGSQTTTYTIDVVSAPVTLPTVTITSPTDGQTVGTSTVPISGTASDATLVDHVTVSVDGTPVIVTGTNHWSTNSGTLSDGIHAITATAFDAAANSVNQTIHVTVNVPVIHTNSASITSATGAGPIHSVTDTGNFTIFVPISESTLSTVGKPTGEAFPYGFSSFNVTGLTTGQTIHVTQTYPTTLPAGTKYWKMEGGVWTDATSLISIHGNNLTLTLTDGGFGDSDGLANGKISDPGEIGIPISVTNNLGTASTFGILASTYTNTVVGTSISGDLGYTTGPTVPAIVDGIIHAADSVYSQAGTAQKAAISTANSQVCTSNLGTSIDLSLVQGGVYTPGVYCTTGAASIGAAGITLTGNGIYIFKIAGALTTVSNSGITLSNGAQSSDVSWVPTQATTLGANTKFAGIILDASGVTISNNVVMTGRVLAFGGTVSTSSDTITVPSFTMSDTINAIPEFGTISALILVMAIVSVVAVSARTRLSITPKY